MGWGGCPACLTRKLTWLGIFSQVQCQEPDGYGEPPEKWLVDISPHLNDVQERVPPQLSYSEQDLDGLMGDSPASSSTLP